MTNPTSSHVSFPFHTQSRTSQQDVGTGSANSHQFCTIAEAAHFLRVSERTIRRRIRAGEIRRAQIGGRLVRIPVTELLRLSGR